MRKFTFVAALCFWVWNALAVEDDLSGYISFSTSNFNLKLDNASQTLASLSPKINPSFDFSPFDVLSQRASNGNYHLGDIVVRYRKQGVAWTELSSATKRSPVQVSKANGNGSSISTSNLSPTIPSNSSLVIVREWGSTQEGDLTLTFSILNNASQEVQIGGLGFPIEFNSIFTSRTAIDTQNKCSLTDPNIGLAGGYLRVTPLSGVGASLVVTPLNLDTKFEGWRYLVEDESTSLGYGSQTFEGFYSWEVYTKAYVEGEWKGTEPWNLPTSKVLKSGETVRYGLKFSVSKDIRGIEDAVKKSGTPLAVGVPGYIVHADTSARLYLYYNSTISSITSDPEGAFTFTALKPGLYKLTPTPQAWGRVRVDITYSNLALQTLSYFITKPGPQVLSDLGTFLTTKQHYNDTTDPFHRAPSIISYDRSTNTQVLQDARVWIAGLSDEGGAGSFLAAAMKISAQPSQSEISILEYFVHETVIGTLQPPNSSAVRKSVFWHQSNITSYAYDKNIDWSSWESWDRADAYRTDRAYDYVHVSALHWCLYRVARFYPQLVENPGWDEYLEKAWKTVMFAVTKENGVGYSEVGLMGETVWGMLLEDLKREGWMTEAGVMEASMKSRAVAWSSELVPYGSEMAWDSTGQEGVYFWSNYFNLTATAEKTVNSILGYMPTVSHWGWNGNARRYWDFLYAGKLQRIERMIHHYGSGLNALPLLRHFQQEPSDLYALRVGYGGNSGPMSNIDQEGSASMAFHSWPDTMKWDAYSGDFGPGFLGHVLGAGTYVVMDPELGLVAFGGEVDELGNGTVVVSPKDSVRRMVYLAMFGTKVEVDAGNIEIMRYEKETGLVWVRIAPSIPSVPTMTFAKSTILRVEKMSQVGSTGNIGIISPNLSLKRGGWLVDLSNGTVDVEIGFGQ